MFDPASLIHELELLKSEVERLSNLASRQEKDINYLIEFIEEQHLKKEFILYKLKKYQGELENGKTN